MIIDKLDNAQMYKNLGEKFLKGFEFLAQNDLQNLDSGRYEISEGVYATVQEYTTKNETDAKFEAHLKYADIQYIIKGNERLGYLNNEDFEVETNYDEDKDIVFGTGNGTFFTAKEGDFLIFFPQDVHKPSISVNEPSTVKKIVVKVKI